MSKPAGVGRSRGIRRSWATPGLVRRFLPMVPMVWLALATPAAWAVGGQPPATAAPPSAGPAPVAPPLPGTCLSHMDCDAKCLAHEAVYLQRAAEHTGPPRLKCGDACIKQCKNACTTQALPGHPGSFMAKCVANAAKDMRCVASLVTLNQCLFQATADTKRSAACLAQVSPACL